MTSTPPLPTTGQTSQPDLFAAAAMRKSTVREKVSHRTRGYRVCTKSYNLCVEYYPLASNLARAIRYVANVQATVFLNFMFRTVATSSKSWNQHVWVVKVVRNSKLFAAASLPFALYRVGYSGWKVIRGTEKFDFALKAIEGLSCLGDSISTFIAGLDVAGVLHRTATLTLSISLISVVLATATIALNIRRLRQGQAAVREIQTCGQAAVAAGESPAAAVVKMLAAKDEYYLEKNFNVDGRKLHDTLQVVAKSAKATNNEDAQNKTVSDKVLRDTIQNLKMRIKTKKWSHRLAILSSVISVIGMSVILLVPPLAVVAYSLLAAAAIISTISILYETKSIRVFLKNLHQIK